MAGLLALNAGAVLPRWRLVDALWGDDPPRTAVKSLHSHVARVRQALDACGLSGLLVTRDAGYALMLDPDDVDAPRFGASARRGRDALLAGAPARAAADLADGLALWRHEMALADADPVGWGAAEVARLSEVRLTASSPQVRNPPGTDPAGIDGSGPGLSPSACAGPPPITQGGGQTHGDRDRAKSSAVPSHHVSLPATRPTRPP